MSKIQIEKLRELDILASNMNIIEDKINISFEESLKFNEAFAKIINKYMYRELHPISMRQGMIIILQELTQNSKENKNVSFDFVYQISYKKYILVARHKKRFLFDLDYIHPKNPKAKFLEISKLGDGRKRDIYSSLLSAYCKSIVEVITAHKWYIDDRKVTISLIEILKNPIFH